jgi:hypothetical protein
VSGKSGGYYGCLAASKGGACENKMLVRRTLAETVILEAVKDEIADPERIATATSACETPSRSRCVAQKCRSS